MLVFVATIAATLFAADPDDGAKDIYALLGWPKLETIDYRIHIGKEGRWTVEHSEKYDIIGLEESEVDDFVEMLFESADSTWVNSRGTENDENQLQCDIKGRSDDVLQLASLFVQLFEREKCDSFQWDGKSFELKFLPIDDRPPARKEKKTIGKFAADLAFSIILIGAINQELEQKGVTQAEMKAAMKELPKMQLVLTTDGNITADAPAEVSEDGKTLTLDLAKFLSDPPEKWSIRIDGL